MASKEKTVVNKTTDDNTKTMPKNKGGRPSKNKKFEKERKEVLNKLLNILEMTDDDNKIFFQEDLDNNKDKQNQIMALEDDVKKYFNYGTWVYFTKKDVKKPYLSLARSILKDMDIKLNFVRTTVVKSGYKITRV